MVRVTRTSKAIQIAAIRTVANSLPNTGVILLTLLISDRCILFAELLNNSGYDHTDNTYQHNL